VSFRSIGHASVGDVIGCDVSHRLRALALRDLTDADRRTNLFDGASNRSPRMFSFRPWSQDVTVFRRPPAGVYVCFLRLYSLSFAFYDNIFVLSQSLFNFIYYLYAFIDERSLFLNLQENRHKFK